MKAYVWLRNRDGTFVVRWQATRRFATEEEARQAAALPFPPPAPKRTSSLPPKLRKFIVDAADFGLDTRSIATALNMCGGTTARGNPWTPAAIRGVVARERERRNQLDREARDAEHRESDDATV